MQIPEGEPPPVRVLYDAEAGALDVEIGGQLFNGTPHPDASLSALDGAPLFLVFSLEIAVECYDAEGNPDDNATCCHAPSWGWSYDQIRYTLCA